MKKNVLLIAILASVGLYAQGGGDSAVFGSPTNSVGLVEAEYNTIEFNNLDISKIDGFASIRDFDDMRFSKAPVDGTVLLFDKWENQGVIEVEDKRYVFSNMNYHVKRATFMSKIDNDSVVSFDLSTFNRIVINDMSFKSIYNPAKRANETFQVIYEGEDFSILKTYSVEVREANPNPMINRGKTKIMKKSAYFMQKDNTIKPLKLKKKSLLGLAGDRSEEMMKYAKKNKLSFKRDEDVTKLFTNIMNK